MKKMILSLILILISSYAFAGELDQKINSFVDDLKIRKKSGMIVKETVNSNTGDILDYSKKVKNILENSLSRRYTILEPNDEKLKEEQEKSVSGYAIKFSDYIVLSSYEVKEEHVYIEIKILSVHNSALVTSEIISVSRESAEPYMKDYTDRELSIIIYQQKRQIKELLNKQREEKERASALLRIREQREKIEMINNGDYEEEIPEPEIDRVFPKNGKAILFGGLLAGFYGSTFHAIANDPDKKESSRGGAKTLGNILYVTAAWCAGSVAYKYYTSNKEIVYIIPSANRITIAMSKKF